MDEVVSLGIAGIVRVSDSQIAETSDNNQRRPMTKLTVIFSKDGVIDVGDCKWLVELSIPERDLQRLSRIIHRRVEYLNHYKYM